MNEQLQQIDKHALMEEIGANSLIEKKWDDIMTSDSICYSLTDISTLGAEFSSLLTVFSELGKAAGSNGTLYEATFPVAGKLAAAKDGSGLLGTIINKNGIAGQARFKEVKQVAQTAGGISSIFMAMAIMAVNQSLKTVAENQKAILSFLDVDKHAQLKGDLIVLKDIINDYQYNWDISQWLSNRETQVLDIKRNAEHNILFYREMIEKKLCAKKNILRFDVSKSLNEIQDRFNYYKLALYLFSFSSFLDIMLLKNFDSNYLEAVKAKIEAYSAEYSNFLEKSIEGIEQIASASVRARAIQGLSAAEGFLGKQIAKIPNKNSKNKLGEKLIAGSEKLDAINLKAVDDTKNAFISLKDSGVQLFGGKIVQINRMYNEPLRLYVSEDKIYLPGN